MISGQVPGLIDIINQAKTTGTDPEFVITVHAPAHQVRNAMYRIIYSGPKP